MESETMKQSLIEELKEKNAQMFERIVQHIEVQDAKIAEKDQKIEELKQTLADVQKSLTNSVDINSHLISLHKTETTKFQAQISRRDKLISDLKEDAKNTNERKEVLHAEIIHFKISNTENLKKIEQQAKKILELGAENATKTFKIAGLNYVHDKIILKLAKESKRKTLKIYDLINENYKIVTEKDNKITESHQKIKSCKKEAEKALQEKQKNITLKDQIISEKCNNITVLEEQNRKKELRISRLQKAVKENQEIIKERNQIIAQNRDKITDLEEQYRKKEQQIIQLHKTVKEKQEIIDGHVNTIEEEKSDKAKIQNSYHKETNQLKNEIACLQTKIPKSKRPAANLFEERTHKKKNRRIPVYYNDDDFWV